MTINQAITNNSMYITVAYFLMRWKFEPEPCFYESDNYSI